MKKVKLVSLFLTAILVFGLSACQKEEPLLTPEMIDLPVVEEKTPEARRDYRVHPIGDSEDVVTLMLYLCGSNLEENWGCATTDLNEILYAEIGENVNIIVETGGSRSWENSMIPGDTNTRWKATNEGLELLTDVGLRDMTDPETLKSFITYCETEYPADRYMLVMWDHGGGTLGGYAADEHFPDSDAMSITEINTVLSDAGVIFDLVGFDACLMATAETAFMLNQYADYMVSSQRIEPGDGWYYTDWITAISKNTSIDTLELGTIIADTFVEHNKDIPGIEGLTLSVVDLTYVEGLFETLYTFFDSAEDMLINDKQFAEMSQARYDSRALSDNYDQVDIVYLVENMDLPVSGEVKEELSKCVAYNVSTIENHNGLCLYFPYTDLSHVEEALGIFDAIGISDNYQSFITAFASLMVGGQIYSGGSDWSDSEWVNNDIIDEYEDYYEEYNYSDELIIDDKGDYYALHLSDEDWELITAIELNVFAYLDDDYSIDLGSDNVYQFDEDGDLMVDFDYTWVALDGEIVPFYAIEEYSDDEEWFSYGYSPSLINEVDAELMIVWDSEHPTGYVPGYRYTYEGSVTQKGYIPLVKGDEVVSLFDVYSDSMGYEYTLDTWTLTVQDEVDVSYEDLGDYDCEAYYVLTDIYGNLYWTESVFYS